MSLHIIKNGVAKEVCDIRVGNSGVMKTGKELYGAVAGVNKPLFNFLPDAKVSGISLKWGKAYRQVWSPSSSYKLVTKAELSEWADLTVNGNTVAISQKVPDSFVDIAPYVYIETNDGRSYRASDGMIRELVRDKLVWTCRSRRIQLVSGSGFSHYNAIYYRSGNSYVYSASLSPANSWKDGPLSPIYNTDPAYGELQLRCGTYANSVRHQMEVQFNNPTWAGRSIPLSIEL